MGTKRSKNRHLVVPLLLTLIAVQLLGLMAVCKAAGYQPLRIEPSRLSLSGKPGQSITGSVTVINKGEDEATLTSVIKDWSLSKTGEIQTTKAGSLPSSLSNLIKFNPKSFKLKKGASQIVRFTVKMPQNVKDTELRGLLIFEQSVPIASAESAAAMAKVQIATTLYVSVGDVKRTCEPVSGAITLVPGTNSYRLTYDFKGTGTGIYKGWAGFAVYKRSELDPEKPPIKEGGFGSVTVLPGGVTQLSAETTMHLAKGTEYVVVIRVEGSEDNAPATKLFSYIP